jgi:hypothetical protein
VFNGLRPVSSNIQQGLLKFTYVDYALPNDTFQVLIKALPVTVFDAVKKTFGPMYLVNFAGFANDGFNVRVTNTTGAIVEELESVELMIEVSQWPVPK